MFGHWLSKGVHLQEIVECPFKKKLSSCAKAKVEGNVKYKKPASYHSLQMKEKNAEQDMPAKNEYHKICNQRPRPIYYKYRTRSQLNSKPTNLVVNDYSFLFSNHASLLLLPVLAW